MACFVFYVQSSMTLSLSADTNTHTHIENSHTLTYIHTHKHTDRRKTEQKKQTCFTQQLHYQREEHMNIFLNKKCILLLRAQLLLSKRVVCINFFNFVEHFLSKCFLILLNG